MKLTMRKMKFQEKTSGAQTITHDQDDIRRKAETKRSRERDICKWFGARGALDHPIPR